MSDSVKQDYANRGDYKPIKRDANGNIMTDGNGKPKKEDLYHSHQNYKAKGKEDKKQQRNGELVDEYRGKTMSADEQRQLDHIISSHPMKPTTMQEEYSRASVALSLPTKILTFSRPITTSTT